MYYYYNHIFLTSRKVFFCFSIAYNITNCLIMSMTVGTVIVWVLFLLYLVCSFFFPGAGLTQGFIWVFQYTRREGFEPQLCIWLDGFQLFQFSRTFKVSECLVGKFESNSSPPPSIGVEDWHSEENDGLPVTSISSTFDCNSGVPWTWRRRESKFQSDCLHASW